MLQRLLIKNYALVEELEIFFKSGLNTITGETGAGKTILVSALGIILGEKYGKDVIRGEAAKAILEGEFKVAQTRELVEFFQNNELDFEENILIRRELNDTGRSRSFINDTPVPAPVIDELGNLLVDLHGQHQHQLLLQPGRHIDYLDEYAGLGDELEELKKAYQQWLQDTKQVKNLILRSEELKKTRDVYDFQLNEIKMVNPFPGEDEDLRKEEQILKNSEFLFNHTSELYKQLYENEGSVSEVLKNALLKLDDLVKIDDRFQEMKSECDNTGILIDEISNSLMEYNNKINFDSDRLEEIRLRSTQLAGIKKKYGPTIEAILEKKQILEKDLSLVDNLDEELKTLRKKAAASLDVLRVLCNSISEKRKTAAKILSKRVTEELSQLGMGKAEFNIVSSFKQVTDGNYIDIEGQKIQISSKGIDHIEFLIAANPGEGFKPLVNVASGGEISRIMLALKTLLAEADKVPVLIFDEIDTGISGRIAQAVGKSLRKLAATHQILCITHLPQIASLGHQHYLVEKTVDNNTTVTTIRQLTDEERIEHTARLIGGDTLSNAHLMSAAELIKGAELADSSAWNQAFEN